jgi:hypothetical protein
MSSKIKKSDACFAPVQELEGYYVAAVAMNGSETVLYNRIYATLISALESADLLNRINGISSAEADVIYAEYVKSGMAV